MKEYQIIYADPPWTYKVWSMEGNKRSACQHYPTMITELCLLATKGKPLRRVSRSVHQVVESPVRDHSRKPDEVRGRIIRLFGNLPRIELFARQKTEGWDVWGNEVQSDLLLN
jgi:N6-adenosine-specific RNA methylase IME4